MNGTTRAFFGVGLLSLVAVALLHLLVLMGMPGLWTAYIHLTLFGWITAIILGVTYHTMPVFSARRFPYPHVTQAHCATFTAGIAVTTAGFIVHRTGLVVTGLALELAAALIFVANVVLLLTSNKVPGAGHPTPPIAGQAQVDRVARRATGGSGISLPLALLLVFGVYTDRLSGSWVLAAEHLATLGWITLMIVGVALHVLPRFSGHGSRGPGWARLQVSTHILALLLMVPALGFGWSKLFALGAAIMAVALTLFAWTIWPAIVAIQAGPVSIPLRIKEQVR